MISLYHRPLIDGHRAPPTSPPDLRQRAIAGVLRHAQEGDLPLCAWTLGLAHQEWLAMLEASFPELGELEAIPAQAYAAIQATTPAAFFALLALLTAHRHQNADERHSDWLARAIAAACLGSRHLWQDLGLADRADVGMLLSTFFPALYRKNSQQLRWKRFLFAELDTQSQLSVTARPKCDRCDEFPICFPPFS